MMTLVSPSLAHRPSKKAIVDQTKEVLREEGEDVRVKEVENLVQVDEEKGGGEGVAEWYNSSVVALPVIMSKLA